MSRGLRIGVEGGRGVLGLGMVWDGGWKGFGKGSLGAPLVEGGERDGSC